MDWFQMTLFDGSKRYKIRKPIRLIELFAGIGSQAKALQNIGADFEHYRICEFDKYAVQSYNAVHGTQFETSDITKINASDLGITDTDKYEYIMTYSFPCFTADNLVLTNKGYKKIVDIKIGDLVLTHDNTYKKVTNFFDNGKTEIYKVKGMGIDEIKTTANHKFYTRTKYRKGHYGIRTFTAPEWKEVKDLKNNDYFGVAINNKSIIPQWKGINFKWSDGRKDRHKNELSQHLKNKDFWWLIGRYIGDGWVRTQGGIIICCAKEETKDITEKLDKMFAYNISEERTVNKIHIPLKELSLFVNEFGKGAKNKKLTSTILDLPEDLLKGFLCGYMSADGCYTNKVFQATSISRELIYGLAQCVAKVYKSPYRIYKTHKKNKCTIEKRVVNQNDTYTLVFKEKRKQDKAFYENGYVWYPYKGYEILDKENVYDIEVEENHSFTVQNTIVHNCQDLSLAGKQKGMEKGSGTRSGLLWEVERLLDECEELPQVLLMENVSEVHGTKNEKNFYKWIEKLESLGYRNYWQDLNAKDYGIPQNRNRTFMVSLLGDYFYEFPQATPLKKRLKDMLETEVDEKYYLSEKATQNLQLNKEVSNAVHSGGRGSTDRHSWDLVKEPQLEQVAQLDGFESSGRIYSENGLCPTINTMGGGNREPKIIQRALAYDECCESLDLDKPFEIISVKLKTRTVGAILQNGTIWFVRKLTPLETWRLMGFDDKDFYNASNAGVSNSQLYKQAGNSIVVNVLEAIFKQMTAKVEV